MAKPVECKIAILMDEYGAWRVIDIDSGDVESTAKEFLDEEGSTSVRRVDLNVTMTPPVASALSVTVPEEAGHVVAAEIED